MGDIILTHAGALAMVILIASVATFWRRLRDKAGHRKQAAIAEVALRQGLFPVRDLLSVTKRVYPLLEPWGIDRPERAFSFRVGGRDAFLYEWRTPSGGFEAGVRVSQTYCHAYVILGPGAPFLRVMAKPLFGRPANCVAFQMDSVFSKTFYVHGTDEGVIRRYLSPELRHFLLAQAKGSGFLGGSEGVALVALGRMSEAEAPRMAVRFERLATVTEVARRR